jgi:hypothetical protein
LKAEIGIDPAELNAVEIEEARKKKEAEEAKKKEEEAKKEGKDDEWVDED